MKEARPKRRLGVLLAAAAVLGAVTVLAVLLPGNVHAVSYSSEELEFVRLLNQYRQTLGLQPLMLSDLCSDASEKHSHDMAAYGFFGHVSEASDYFAPGSDAGQRLIACGYDYTLGWTPALNGLPLARENVAAGYPTAAAVLAAWQGSPIHDQNMTDPNMQVVGVGLVYSAESSQGYYWTVDLGAYVDPTAHWVDDTADATSSTYQTTTTTATTTTTTTATTTTTTAPTSTTTTTTGATSTTVVSTTTSTMHPPTTTPPSEISFPDVPSDHRFHDAVVTLAAVGAISGRSDGRFYPDSELTRAQCAKIVVSALGKHTEVIEAASSPSFEDVPYKGMSYPFDYVEEAAALGIVHGYADGRFLPDDKVTRLQLVLMLVRAGDAALSPLPLGFVCPFTDVPASARETVARALYNGLVNGKTTRLFDPYAPVTRGQAAQMICALLRLLQDHSGENGN